MNLLESTYGALLDASLLPGGVVGIFVVVCILGFAGAPLWLWTVSWGAALWVLGAPPWLGLVYVVLALVLNLRPLRRVLLSAPIMSVLQRVNILPVISETEQAVLDAGDVWIEGELFSGKPDFKRLNAQPYPDLTEEERAFLDGPVNEVCRMANDWEVHVNKDIPEEAWNYIKENRFFGMIIPKAYGGLEFSASANSAVVGKLISRSLTLGLTVMVPNSLGPAELLIHYGTEEQKKYYLPRLACGEEVPCFALTEPTAGSDAGSIQANGLVFKGEDGQLYLKLNWEKRYITLAMVSTVVGLAFKLKDPDNLLGKSENPGITCALIPTRTPGVVINRRHDQMGVPFYNSPVEGHDVIVPIDSIIGGVEGVGQGWRMLMESLAAGRGISLPAMALAGTKFVARAAGAYATVRRQFGLSIGQFEGIEEPLARIGAFAYLMEATRRYTCGALDQGARPAVATAIVKYNLTELHRKAINDGMDIFAGNAIARGPRNLLAHIYSWTPITIAVEGANILTRTLMIFGQGAIRCHPYAAAEIKALKSGNTEAFDLALWRHIRHIVRNLFRSIFLSISQGHLAISPVSGPAARYYRKLAWASATFAILADLTMVALGGELKRREKITGRFADLFSCMYLGTATLRRFEAEGRRTDDLPLLHWSMQFILAQLQHSFDSLLKNLKVPGLGLLVRGPIALWSRINRIETMPSDELGAQVARIIQTPGPQRDRLTEGIYVPDDPNEALGRLERAFKISYDAAAVDRKIRDAVRAQKLPKGRPRELVSVALESGIIGAEESRLIEEAEAARNDAIQVDSFTVEEYFSSTPAKPQNVEERHFTSDN